MLGMKLVRLIEAHSETVSRGLAEQLHSSDRTSDFREVSREDLQRRALEVYRNLGEWLLQKTESDISTRFRMIAVQRASEGIRLSQYIWALTLSRDHLWRFLRQQAYADTIFELYGELEMLQLLNQFFDRAIYHAIIGHQEAIRETTGKGDLRRIRDLAVSIGLMSA